MKDVIFLTDDGYYKNEYYVYKAYYHIFRRPQTFNEIRSNSAAKADGIKTRGKRRCIPTSYDDLCFSYPHGKDWKRFTKKKRQWSK